jgi:hypothetical protein
VAPSNLITLLDSIPPYWEAIRLVFFERMGDPKTLEGKAQLMRHEAASVGVPRVAFPWRAGKASYQGKIEAGGQSIPISTTQTIEEQGGNWVVIGTAKMPMGDAVDITTLGKATLVPRKRVLTQGPAAIEPTFADGKATGTVAMAGEPKPVSVELGGEMFADGVGAHEAIASLPLAEGFTTTYRNFDVRQQKVMLKQAKVAGVESVTVPAGTLQAWKVEIASAEGEPGQTTIWVAKNTRKVVKISATLPQMGGAVLTSELQP